MHRHRAVAIAVVCAFGTFFVPSDTFAQLETEDLVVDLDAGDESAGEDFWINLVDDSPVGDFEKVGEPFVEDINGATAVTFNFDFTDDFYQSVEFASEGLIGVDATRTIEAWVFNPEIASEETIVSWGRRGGPDGSNMSFNYGFHGNFGAIGHWGGNGPDIGWVDNAFTAGAPVAGQWHHLVYAYDGEVTRVYADGCISEEQCDANNEVLGPGVINTHGETRITVAGQLEPDGIAINLPLKGSLSIGRLRIHDGVLTDEQIANNYELEREDFPITPVAPVFVGVPDDETYLAGEAEYTATFAVDGFPLPSVEIVAAPANTSLTESGKFARRGSLSVPLPDPQPGSFEITIKASNSAGETEASWTVSREGLPPVGQLAVAGQLVVHLDADDESAGEDFWTNLAEDSEAGDFERVGEPFLETVEGVAAVTFNPPDGFTDDFYQSIENAPESIIGPDPKRSIEAWVYNPEIASEETIVAWGRRGGPDGSNMSFNYGDHGNFGAIGHWGGATADIGWVDNDFTPGAPEAGIWHYLVYTYDGTTTRVYADGVLQNEEELGVGAIDTHCCTRITVAGQLEPDGVAVNIPLKGSLSIARLRIHSDTLRDAEIEHNFNTEFSDFFDPVAPEITGVPAEDEIGPTETVYARQLSISGVPVPTVEALSPDGATVTPGGLVNYTIPDPRPASFEVRVRATNSEGTAEVNWTVNAVMPADLSSGPAHRYSFTADASDANGGADGIGYGEVAFDGQAVFTNNPGAQSSNDNGQSPPADPPGAYVDLPNEMISALGNNVTFELWATWNGNAFSPAWQRLFDLGNSVGGEDFSDGGATTYNLFLTPRSGGNSLRFGYRDGPTGVERQLNAATMPNGVEQHIVVVWNGDEGRVALFVDGSRVDQNDTHFSIADMLELNNWLGRSQWDDPMLDGSINEFRLYDRALSWSEVLGNFEAGADTVTGDGGGQEFRRGDANNDGAVNIADMIFMLNDLFGDGSAPPCTETADVNGDAAYNIADPIFGLNRLFGDGPPPIGGHGPEGTDCGPDPSPADSLGCDLYDKC